MNRKKTVIQTTAVRTRDSIIVVKNSETFQGITIMTGKPVHLAVDKIMTGEPADQCPCPKKIR